jgi:hypothetical protein
MKVLKPLGQLEIVLGTCCLCMKMEVVVEKSKVYKAKIEANKVPIKGKIVLSLLHRLDISSINI